MRRRGNRSRWARSARRGLVAVSVTAVVVLLAGGVSSGALASQGPPLNAGEAHGVVHVRGARHGGGGSPLLLFHNGAIMNSSVVHAIYWGSSWSNSSFFGDKISGLDTFYAGANNSNYMKTNTEYTGTNGTVSPGVTYQGNLVDTSPGPSKAPSTGTVLAEVAKEITSPVANGYYPVYVDLPRGQAGYCAWHSYGTIGTTPVQFAFFFNLDGDPGCDPQSTVSAQSQGLAALANVSGHELSEAVTDPRNGGWYDGSGAENADKCAWAFNVPSVTFSNGSQWKIQGNWSNNAYTAGTGYPNTSGQTGCLDGH
jgi:hypothetical protein